MPRMSLERQRRLFAMSCLAAVLGLVLWFVLPPLPIIWGPSASASDIAAGRELFEHEWQPNDPLAHGDGLGPVFNARSCAACHFQGGLGGAGERMHNAIGYEVAARPGDSEIHEGSLHNFSTKPEYQETMAVLKSIYPVVPGRTIRQPHCGPMTIPDFDPVRTQTVQPTALFGAGWIDLISERAIAQNQRNRQVRAVTREFSLDFGSIPVGKIRRTDDGQIGKFGWKGQFGSLTDFVAAACANELGLGTPSMAQAKPLRASDYESAPDLDRKQFRQLVAFVKTLPRPTEMVPEEPTQRAKAEHGKKVFTEVGCAACHVPNLGGVKGVYSDFLLYTLDNPTPAGGVAGGNYGNDPPAQLNLPPRPEELPRSEEWKTPPLWGVADSAPYFHDGASTTLESAIARHQGQAKAVTTAFDQRSRDDQVALVAFLKTLKAPADASTLRDPSVTRLKR